LERIESKIKLLRTFQQKKPGSKPDDCLTEESFPYWLLQRKVDGFIGWLKQHDLGTAGNEQCGCKDRRKYAPHPVSGTPEYSLCFDGKLPKQNDCVVYDFGIRTDVAVGVELLKEFGCEVHGFDPSPITQNFAKTFKPPKNYTLHLYGGGAIDGNIKLFEYGWQQVSMFRPYPDREHGTPQITGELKLPVRRVPSLMKEFGHKYVDVLKIDVEGSEYAILHDIIDTFGPTGDLPFDHILVEWHNFGIDERYGSSHHINYLVHILNGFGFKMFAMNGFWVQPGDNTSTDFYPWRYANARFCKHCCVTLDIRNLNKMGDN